MTNPFYQYLSGCITTAFLVLGAYFLRFWRRTGDRLFVFFSVAFLLFAVERVVFALTTAPNSESNAGIYLLRLAGFVVILAAIVDKNRVRGG